MVQPKSDYQQILSLVFAREGERNAEYVAASRASDDKVEIPPSVSERIVRVWNRIFPHRGVRFKDGQVLAAMFDQTYTGVQMSDGERAALYLMARVLTAPDGALLIVDEPEVHLHRAVRDDLWDALEAERADCVFVYLTHDVDFAAARPTTRTLWLQSYDGSAWVWEPVEPVEGLPDALVRELVGSRQDVLFVEGTAGSLDTAVYAAAYPDLHVVPLGGCRRVIDYTRALREAASLHHLHARGIVDRDRRETSEIARLESQNVRVLDVAEVENVVLTPAVVRVVAERLAMDPDVVTEKVERLVLERLAAQRDGQIAEHVMYRVDGAVKRALDTSGASAAELEAAVAAVPGQVDVPGTWSAVASDFDVALADRDYASALRLFNEKGLVRQVSNNVLRQARVGNEDGLSALVRRLIQVGHEPLLDALRSVLPDLEPGEWAGATEVGETEREDLTLNATAATATRT